MSIFFIGAVTFFGLVRALTAGSQAAAFVVVFMLPALGVFSLLETGGEVTEHVSMLVGVLLG